MTTPCASVLDHLCPSSARAGQVRGRGHAATQESDQPAVNHVVGCFFGYRKKPNSGSSGALPACVRARECLHVFLGSNPPVHERVHENIPALCFSHTSPSQDTHAHHLFLGTSVTLYTRRGVGGGVVAQLVHPLSRVAFSHELLKLPRFPPTPVFNS